MTSITLIAASRRFIASHEDPRSGAKPSIPIVPLYGTGIARVRGIEGSKMSKSEIPPELPFAWTSPRHAYTSPDFRSADAL
jgi:hypothetical protein